MTNPCLGCFMIPCRTSKQKKIMILTFDTNLRTHRNLILLACPVLWNWSYTDLPTCTDFRGTYRFWPSITISRFHAVVYRFWKMREFLGLADFVLSCFHRYSVILSASCTYRQSRRCVAAINSPPGAMSQC